MKLNQKIVLVTGGSSGIGRAAALAFATEGAQVMITARRADKAAETVDLIRAAGGDAAFTVCDVRQRDQCDRTVAETIAHYGRIDILFNNAGIVPLGTVIETSDETWLDVFATNVHGTFYMARAVLPHMIAQGGGVILNNASDWAVVGGHGAAAYSATKGAVALLTKSMALDHARQGIRVNAICPGDTVVERWRETWTLPEEVTFEERLKSLGASFPMGRVGTVDEIARACVFLVSDESSYMTGQLLVIDGGNTAGGASTKYE